MEESPLYLSHQLISYRGNKRKLLDLLDVGLKFVSGRVGKEKLDILDGFSGSGVCSRFFKRYASSLVTNDLQPYAAILSDCYLRNRSEIDMSQLRSIVQELRTLKLEPCDGFIQRLYAPADDQNIQPGERVYFTSRNARILDNICRAAQELDPELRPLILGPLLASASKHSNTAGHFKSFLRDRHTKLGAFGGSTGSWRDVIMAEIDLSVPVLSRFETDCRSTCMDIDALVDEMDGVDVAYFDPPYGPQPYGYLYFMLDLLVTYKEPRDISEVAGVPTDWSRSQYSTEKDTLDLIVSLVKRVPASFVMLSYSDEGQITPERLTAALAEFGKIQIVDRQHQRMNSAWGSDKHGTRGQKGSRPMVTESLYVVEKS